MKSILIPTSFTDVARHATDYALKLFGNEKIKITLLNAFESLESLPMEEDSNPYCFYFFLFFIFYYYYYYYYYSLTNGGLEKDTW